MWMGRPHSHSASLLGSTLKSSLSLRALPPSPQSLSWERSRTKPNYAHPSCLSSTLVTQQGRDTGQPSSGRGCRYYRGRNDLFRHHSYVLEETPDPDAHILIELIRIFQTLHNFQFHFRLLQSLPRNLVLFYMKPALATSSGTVRIYNIIFIGRGDSL